MSQLNCSLCSNVCYFKRRPKDDDIFGAPCDGCKVIICKNCSEISTTEADAISLNKRSISFYCFDCKKEINELPQYKKANEQLEKAKNDIKKRDSHITKLTTKHEEYISKLKGEISTIKKENELLKVNTADSNTSVSKTIDDSPQVNINRNIADAHERNITLAKDLDELKSKYTTSKQQLEDLNEIKQNCLTTIETLNAEIEVYVNDLKVSKNENVHLREKLSALRGSNACTNQTLTSIKTTASTQTMKTMDVDCSKSPSVIPSGVSPQTKKKQLLIMGGNNARGTGTLLKNLTNKTFDTNCQFDDRFKLSELICECSKLCKKFNRDDYVLVFIPSFDAIIGRNITKDEMDRLARETSHTNLIVIGCGYHLNRPVLNSFIHGINNFVISYLHEVNIPFVPLTSTNVNGVLSYDSKKELIMFLVNNYILAPSKNFLVYRRIETNPTTNA